MRVRGCFLICEHFSLYLGSSPQAPPPLVQWTHDDVMKWFNALPEGDRKAYRKFFENAEHFPPEATGKHLARMTKEDFVAILGRTLGASLYEELQLLKAKCTFIMICRFSHTTLAAAPVSVPAASAAVGTRIAFHVFFLLF